MLDTSPIDKAMEIESGVDERVLTASRVLSAYRHLQRAVGAHSALLSRQDMEMASDIVNRFKMLADAIYSGRLDYTNKEKTTSKPIAALNRLVRILYRHEKVYPRQYAEMWLPSTIEYHPDARILLVGEAPAYVEIGCGIPLADVTAIKASRCGGCPNMAQCYDYLMNGGGKPGLGPPCTYTGENEQARTRNLSMKFRDVRNSGTILRAAMIDAGMRRSFWGDEYGGELVNVTNVSKLAKDKEKEKEERQQQEADGKEKKAKRKSADSIPQDYIDILHAEAFLTRPTVTVCLGSYASAAVFGRRREVWDIDVISYRPPFGFVVQTFHPARALHGLEDPENGPTVRHIRMALNKAVSILQGDPRYTTTADMVSVIRVETAIV